MIALRGAVAGASSGGADALSPCRAKPASAATAASGYRKSAGRPAIERASEKKRGYVMNTESSGLSPWALTSAIPCAIARGVTMIGVTVMVRTASAPSSARASSTAWRKLSGVADGSMSTGFATAASAGRKPRSA